MWDADWKHNLVSVSNKGQTATVSACEEYACQQNYRMAIRGTIGWMFGKHHWKMKVCAVNKICRCSSPSSCSCRYYPIAFGVCAEFLSKSEIHSHRGWCGKRIVGFNGKCFPGDKHISGSGFTIHNGDVLDLTIDLSVRTLKINSERSGSTIVAKVPDGKIYPWVGFTGSKYSSTSVTIVN